MLQAEGHSLLLPSQVLGWGPGLGLALLLGCLGRMHRETGTRGLERLGCQVDLGAGHPRVLWGGSGGVPEGTGSTARAARVRAGSRKDCEW